MNIAIFKDLTTEGYLQELEKESEKYAGLFVDMENKKERKFVKEKASLIGGLLKSLDRARIDKKKDYAQQVEAEAESIKDRLEEANKPFTLLIDEHKEKRAKILAEEKAKQDAIELKLKIEEDHELAIMMDKSITFDKAEKIRLQKEREDQIAAEAREQAEREKIAAEDRAEQAERDRILAEEKARRDAIAAAEQAERDRIQAAEDARIAEQKRAEQAALEEKLRIEKLEANKRHVGKVRGEIKAHIMNSCNISEADAKAVVLSLGKCERITINY